MSLSSPKNPVFISEGVASDAQPVSNLDSNQNATLINQLHGINTSNAAGAGIPKQVSSVQVSIANAQEGATCTVSILYRIDPTDKNFAGVAILVKGYQGNNQLVQVSSGTSSPTKFVLNNTGEIVSFTVQAFGNGGSAPLAGSPTCSGTLPQSTAGGFGSSTVTSSPTGLTMPPEFSVAGSGSSSIVVSKVNEDHNTVWAGPPGGTAAPAQPSFRRLVDTDFPFGNVRGMLANLDTTLMVGLGMTPAAPIGTVAAVLPTSTEGPMLQNTSQAIANGQGVWFGNNTNVAVHAASLKYMRARAGISDNGTILLNLGFTDAKPGAALQQAIPTTQSTLAFRFNTGDVNWSAVACDGGGTATILDLGVAADTDVHDWLILCSSGQADFYIDNVFCGSITTHLPTAVMGPYAGIQANAKVLKMSYMWWCSQ